MTGLGRFEFWGAFGIASIRFERLILSSKELHDRPNKLVDQCLNLARIQVSKL